MIFNIKKWVEQKEIYSSLNKFISLAFMSLKVSIHVSPDTCNGVSDSHKSTKGVLAQSVSVLCANAVSSACRD